MAYTKTVWSDRQVQFPLRFQQTLVSGTTYDFTPVEGTITTAGTPLTASNLNNIENGVADVDTRLTSVEGTYVKKDGSVNMTGALFIDAGGELLKLRAGATTDHAYMAFYADSQAQGTRSGYFGFGSAGTPDISLNNSVTNGSIFLVPNGTGGVYINNGGTGLGSLTGQLNHQVGAGYFTVGAYPGKGTGNARIFYDSAGSLTFWNQAGAYISLQASAFNVNSQRDSKTDIVADTSDALSMVKGTTVYDYHLLSELVQLDAEGNVIGENDPAKVKKRKGLILDEAPTSIVSTEGGIDLYAMCSMLWKSVQQLSAKIDNLDLKINQKTQQLDDKKQDKPIQ